MKLKIMQFTGVGVRPASRLDLLGQSIGRGQQRRRWADSSLRLLLTSVSSGFGFEDDAFGEILSSPTPGQEQQWLHPEGSHAIPSAD